MPKSPRAPSRRKVLDAGTKTALLLSIPGSLSACLQIKDNASLVESGVVKIALQSGLNCWQGTCFQYDSVNRKVHVPGREPASLPNQVDVSSGFVTEDEFALLLDIARSSPRLAFGDGSNGGSAGGDSGASSGGGGSSPGGGGGSGN